MRHDDSFLGDDRRRDNMGVFPPGCRLAYALNGGNESWRRRNVGRRKRPFHFAAPIFDFINRDSHAGMQIPHPFRVDIVGPYWLERLCFGEVQSYGDAQRLSRQGGILVPSVQCIIARFQVWRTPPASSGCCNTPPDPVSCRLHPRQQGISAADARRCTPMQCAGLKTADYSLDLDARLPEIEQQAQVQPGCRQVIDALGHVRFVERANRFQFNHDGIVDQQVGYVLAGDDTVIMDGNRLLLQDHQASLAQFMRQGIFINLLRKTGTEPIHDPKRAADNHPRKPIHRNTIGVHLRTSAAKIPYLR